WNGKYFIDYPSMEKNISCSNNFDILGNSLSILNDIASEEQIESIFRFVMDLATPFGFKMTDTFLPALNLEEKELMQNHKAVIWPFTNGYMLDAMITKGTSNWQSIAKKEFSKWEKLIGFYEWYDIEKGKGYGSIDQVWSAALYLRIHAKLNL